MFTYCGNNPTVYRDDTGHFLSPTAVIKEDDGSGDRKNDGNEHRDVTDEIRSVLTKSAAYARTKRIACERSLFDSIFVLKDVYLDFYLLVNHQADWDIKLKEPWEKTIGTIYPGKNAEVIFCGYTMTPECLGNFTYGYLGYAYGIPFPILLGGSYYAAGFPIKMNALTNEITDWGYIAMGYTFAKEGYLEGRSC
jgi:hypothetical protein